MQSEAEALNRPDKARYLRRDAFKVTCPTCGSGPGKACWGTRTVRTRVHQARLQADLHPE